MIEPEGINIFGISDPFLAHGDIGQHFAQVANGHQARTGALIDERIHLHEMRPDKSF